MFVRSHFQNDACIKFRAGDTVLEKKQQICSEMWNNPSSATSQYGAAASYLRSSSTGCLETCRSWCTWWPGFSDAGNCRCLCALRELRSPSTRWQGPGWRKRESPGFAIFHNWSRVQEKKLHEHELFKQRGQGDLAESSKTRTEEASSHACKQPIAGF